MGSNSRERQGGHKGGNGHSRMTAVNKAEWETSPDSNLAEYKMNKISYVFECTEKRCRQMTVWTHMSGKYVENKHILKR